MIKELIKAIARENVEVSEDELMADNVETDVRDAFIGEYGEIEADDVTDKKIKELINNLPESSAALTSNEISELCESFLDLDVASYVFEEATKPGTCDGPDSKSVNVDEIGAVKEPAKEGDDEELDLDELNGTEDAIDLDDDDVEEATEEDITDDQKKEAKEMRELEDKEAEEKPAKESNVIDLESDLYADDEEINDVGVSEGNDEDEIELDDEDLEESDLYADDEEINDVGVSEGNDEDEIELDDEDIFESADSDTCPKCGNDPCTCKKDKDDKDDKKDKGAKGEEKKAPKKEESDDAVDLDDAEESWIW